MGQIACELCSSNFDDDLIELTIPVPNGNNDEDELNNYDVKTVLMCCVCVATQRYKEE